MGCASGGSGTGTRARGSPAGPSVSAGGEVAHPEADDLFPLKAMAGSCLVPGRSRPFDRETASAVPGGTHMLMERVEAAFRTHRLDQGTRVNRSLTPDPQ